MGNNLKKKFNQEKDIQLKIILNKVCYYPWEKVSGNLVIKPKKFIKDEIFNNTIAIIKIFQISGYHYSTGNSEDDINDSAKEESEIFSNNIDFKNFKGANLLLGINIPFSIQIPPGIQPSIYDKGKYSRYYVKHFISFDLPGINAKRALIIFIKGFKNYTFQNKLLKIPAIKFGDFYIEKKYKLKAGKVPCLLKIPKNSFNYFEPIIFEFYLDSSEFIKEIEKVKISLNRIIYFNSDKDHNKHYYTYTNTELIWKEYPMNINSDKFKINEGFLLSNYYSLRNKYLYFESFKEIEIDSELYNYQLIPFCLGGLISIECCLKAEIFYKNHKRKHNLTLPIEIFEYDFQYNEDDLYNIKKKESNEKENNDKKIDKNSPYYDINSLDEEDSKVENLEKDDFVVIEEDDFEKAFFQEKNKK